MKDNQWYFSTMDILSILNLKQSPPDVGKKHKKKVTTYFKNKID